MISRTEAFLRAGKIYGDIQTGEYVYMPSGEVGVAVPKFVFEKGGIRQEIDNQEALRLIRVLSLKLVKHPQWGESAV